MNFNRLLKDIKTPRGIIASALGAAFLFSLAVFQAKTPGRRYVFRFQSVDSGRNNIEWRFLKKIKGSQKQALYVDELLLGPRTERSRPLFSPGTKAEFCFERGRVLYVCLTSSSLEKTGNASEIMDGIALFKKNVNAAFPMLKKIEIYIDGKGILEE